MLGILQKAKFTASAAGDAAEDEEISGKMRKPIMTLPALINVITIRQKYITILSPALRVSEGLNEIESSFALPAETLLYVMKIS